MASERPKREGVYVYTIAAGVPRTPAAKNAVPRGWGSMMMMKSKTFRERSGGREKVAVEPRKSVSEVEGNRGSESRKSVSEVEGNRGPVAAAAFLQVKVLVSDMPGFMQVHAFRCARTTYDNLDKFSSKYMAYNIKKEFDKVYGATWHCIVGSSFGSFVTHSTGCFLYFSMENLYFLVFKTKVERPLLPQL